METKVKMEKGYKPIKTQAFKNSMKNSKGKTRKIPPWMILCG